MEVNLHKLFGTFEKLATGPDRLLFTWNRLEPIRTGSM